MGKYSRIDAKFLRIDDWLYKLNDMDRILLDRIEKLESKIKKGKGVTDEETK